MLSEQVRDLDTRRMMRIKKGILQILFISLIVIILIAGCSIIGSEEELPIYAIDIDPAHQTCEGNDQCALVYIDCSSCDCGEAVNIQFEEYYQNLYQEVCQDYNGPVCEMFCPKVNLICQNNQCMAEPTQ